VLQPSQRVEARHSTQIYDLGAQAVGQETRRFIVLGINPTPPADSLALPPGQRSGAFSVSAAGEGPGSPGGTAIGIPEGGAGGSGEGGDESTGLGSGGHGGGLVTPATGATVSTGTEAEVKRGESGVILPAVAAAALVYPVISPPRPTHSGIVVSAGPAGGGGLRIYGVLRAGKIYTTYLPMPGKNWILQYCAHSAVGQDDARTSRSLEVRLESPLVPPSAQDQFDFRRPPLPKNKTVQMIVLKGFIRQDGSVDNLSVLQGLDGMANEAALIAFGRWKFRPATQGGKPVEVEILVGIPVVASGS